MDTLVASCNVTLHNLSVCVCVADIPDDSLGLGAGGAQASSSADVPKGSNKRRAA